MPDALIFDFDGVIADAEPLHYRAFLEVLAGDGISFSWEDYLATYIGFDDRDAFRVLFEQAGRPLEEKLLRDLIARKARAFGELVAGEGAPAFPGVAELLQEARGEVPLGLCSGALRQDIEPILATLGLEGTFDVIVAADDVAASKPDPAGYRLTLDRLKQRFGREFDPPLCLAVEDTPTGIEAARGAGLAVLAVTNSHPRAALAQATAVVDSLEGMTLERLRAIL